MRAGSGVAACDMMEALSLRDPRQVAEGAKRAEAGFKKALAIDPKDEVTLNALVHLYEQTGKYEPALAIHRQRLATHPDNPQFYARIANVYTMQKNVQGVLDTWQQYRKRKPDDVLSYIGSAQVLESSARWEEAVKEWKAWLDRHPDDGNILIAHAKALTLLKRLDEARAEYKKVLALKDPEKGKVEIAAARANRLESLKGLASLAQQQNRIEEAVEWQRQAQKMETAQAEKTSRPQPNETYLAIVRTYEQGGKIEEAIKECQKWAEALPKDPQPYAELARLREGQKRIEDAASAYRKGAERARDPVAYRLQAAELYRRNHKNDLALAEYEAIRAKYPNDARPLSPMAQTYELQGKDEKALAAYETLIKADPTAYWVEDRRALCLIRLKRYPEARALYEKEIARVPENFQPYADLSRVYGLEGRQEAYLPWLKARLETTPANRTLQTVVLDEHIRLKREAEGWAYLKALVMEKNRAKRPVLETFSSLLVQRSKRAEALDVYRVIAAQNPKDLDVQNTLAEQLFAGDDKARDEAIKIYETQIARADLSVAERLGLRRKLADKLEAVKRTEDAIAQCRAILKEQPGEFNTSMVLSRLLTAAGRWPEAVTVLLNQSQKKDYPVPVRATILNTVAGLYEKNGKKTDAIGQYRETLRLDPNNADATAALKRLEAAGAGQ